MIVVTAADMMQTRTEPSILKTRGPRRLSPSHKKKKKKKIGRWVEVHSMVTNNTTDLLEERYFTAKQYMAHEGCWEGGRIF